MARHRTPARLNRKMYEGELTRLQVELARMLEWVRQEGIRVSVLFEGRDAAGKGGVIKRIAGRAKDEMFVPTDIPESLDG